MIDPDAIVDARGLLCPWPALRLARAARALGDAGTIQILADDPSAPGEIARLCAERGWTMVPDASESAAFGIVIG